MNKETMLDLMKIGAFILPFMISFFVWCSSLETRIKLIEEKHTVIQEIRNDLKEIRLDINDLKIKITRIESKNNIQ